MTSDTTESVMDSASRVQNCRPVTKFGKVHQAGSVEEDILTFKRSLYYFELVSFFKNYPENSLLHSDTRCYLYYIIRRIQAQSVCEVGTYYAGTTEVLARAIQENGGGYIYTVDPGNQEIIKSNIAKWPDELQGLVQNLHATSMDAYMTLGRSKFDVLFVDGGHAYEVALFDLHMAAKMSTDKAVIVVDNADQPTVLWAVKDFLSTQPNWKEVGDSLSRHTGAAITRPPESFSDGQCIILTKRKGIVLGGNPRSILLRHENPGVAGLEFSFAAPAPQGILRGVAFFRVYGRGLVFCEHRAEFEAPVSAGETGTSVAFRPELLSLRWLGSREENEAYLIDGVMYYGKRPEEGRREVELMLFWDSTGSSDEHLSLESEPTLTPATV